MLGIPGPRKGAQGLASQVWVTAERRTHGDAWRCLDGLRWQQRGLGGGSNSRSQTGEGAAKGACGSTRPSVGRSGRSTPWTVAGGNSRTLERTGHKHRAREVWALGPAAPEMKTFTERSRRWRPPLGPPASALPESGPHRSHASGSHEPRKREGVASRWSSRARPDGSERTGCRAAVRRRHSVTPKERAGAE